MLFPQPPNEAERLSVLHQLAILDTPPSPAIDRICRIARQIFEVPMVFVTFLDAHRQWFKAKPDETGICETSRNDAFCNFTILHDEVFVIPDARADRTFARNRYVTGEPYIRFYAGAPLTIRRGIHLGSLCVVDTKPRDFGPQETRLLKGLSRLVVDEIWLHQLSETGRAAIEMLSSDPRDRHLEFETSQAPTNAQIRAARGLLNWSARDLAEAANVSETSVKRIEAQGEGPIRRDSLEAVVRAFHKHGVKFTRRPDGEIGISQVPSNRRTASHNEQASSPTIAG